MKDSHLCPANGNRPAIRWPAERTFGSEREDRRPEQAARRSTLSGVHGRHSDPMRHAIKHTGRGDGHQQGRAAGIVVNMRTALPLIVRAVVRRIVVVVIAVVVVVVTIMVVLMAMAVVIMATVHMVQIAIRMRVEEYVRENTARRPMGRADHRRQRKQEHHRPDQGHAASARSFQSRQHAVR